MLVNTDPHVHPHWIDYESFCYSLWWVYTKKEHFNKALNTMQTYVIAFKDTTRSPKQIKRQGWNRMICNVQCREIIRKILWVPNCNRDNFVSYFDGLMQTPWSYIPFALSHRFASMPWCHNTTVPYQCSHNTVYSISMVIKSINKDMVPVVLFCAFVVVFVFFCHWLYCIPRQIYDIYSLIVFGYLTGTRVIVPVWSMGKTTKPKVDKP